VRIIMDPIYVGTPPTHFGGFDGFDWDAFVHGPQSPAATVPSTPSLSLASVVVTPEFASGSSSDTVAMDISFAGDDAPSQTGTDDFCDLDLYASSATCFVHCVRALCLHVCCRIYLLLCCFLIQCSSMLIEGGRLRCGAGGARRTQDELSPSVAPSGHAAATTPVEVRDYAVDAWQVSRNEKTLANGTRRLWHHCSSKDKTKCKAKMIIDTKPGHTTRRTMRGGHNHPVPTHIRAPAAMREQAKIAFAADATPTHVMHQQARSVLDGSVPASAMPTLNALRQAKHRQKALTLLSLSLSPSFVLCRSLTFGCACVHVCMCVCGLKAEEFPAPTEGDGLKLLSGKYQYLKVHKCIPDARRRSLSYAFPFALVDC
jgi:hypothetical protein